jgi:hypothetical protein
MSEYLYKMTCVNNISDDGRKMELTIIGRIYECYDDVVDSNYFILLDDSQIFKKHYPKNYFLDVYKYRKETLNIILK